MSLFSPEHRSAAEVITAAGKRQHIIDIATDGEHRAEVIDHPGLWQAPGPATETRPVSTEQVVEQGNKLVSLASFRDQQKADQIAQARQDVLREAA